MAQDVFQFKDLTVESRPRALCGDCNQSFFVDWVQFIVLRKHLIPVERII